MQATMICHDTERLQSLRQWAEAEGVEVRQSLLRHDGASLRTLLDQSQGDVLVVESARGGMQQDLSAIEAISRSQPDLRILMLSAHRDADALLQAMRAGVREVLPEQPQPAEFAAALDRLKQRSSASREPARARVVAFVACKGGSGATFLATNVAYALATTHSRNTLLIDLDLHYGDAAYFVSDGRAPSSLTDLAQQADRLDASLLQASTIAVAPNFRLLASPEEPEAALGITANQFERVLDMACAHHDFVVLDIERMLDPMAIKGLDRAEAIYLVTENMVPHARDARRLVRVLRALGYPDSKLRLVVNRYDPRGGIELSRLEEVVGLKVAHTIRESFAEVAEAANTGVPLVQIHPGNSAARGLGDIADALVDRHARAHAQGGWLARLMGPAN